MLDKSVVAKARQMYQSGYYTYAQIAETLDISRSSVYSFCKDLVKKKGLNSKESSGSTTVVAVHEQSSDDNAHEITNTCASVANIAKNAPNANSTANSDCQDDVSQASTKDESSILEPTPSSTVASNSSSTPPSKASSNPSSTPSVSSDSEEVGIKFGSYALINKAIYDLRFDKTLKSAIKLAHLESKVHVETLIDLACYSLFIADGKALSLEQYASDHCLFDHAQKFPGENDLAQLLEGPLFNLQHALGETLFKTFEKSDELIITYDLSDSLQTSGNLNIINGRSFRSVTTLDGFYVAQARRAYDGMPFTFELIKESLPSLKSLSEFDNTLPDDTDDRHTVFLDKGTFTDSFINDLEHRGFNVVLYCDGRSAVITKLVNEHGAELSSSAQMLSAKAPLISGKTIKGKFLGKERYMHFFYDRGASTPSISFINQVKVKSGNQINDELKDKLHCFSCIATSELMDAAQAYDRYSALTKTQSLLKVPSNINKQSLRYNDIAQLLTGACVVRFISSVLQAYINSKLALDPDKTDNHEQSLSALSALEHLDKIRLISGGDLVPTTPFDQHSQHILKCFDIDPTFVANLADSLCTQAD
ncbi:MAG: hypothetical protein SOV16_06810 [Anaerobiospirillum succiniciproducens]|uniref:hypothetical protein n=1 Tax=Anaerobiospirillum succiniciproducens TaxID=13335 RepID=UPI002A74FC05|nr:hypothetical protein [Anaerobiospirillum succiniciproducens]MDY2798864.1 hypothetical protein [Anaerobiospirillum succiniciproducens]